MPARRATQPAGSTMIFFILAAVAAVAVGAWRQIPGVGLALLVLIAGTIVEPVPQLTGRKVAGRPPEPANPGEEARMRSYRMWQEVRWRLAVPTWDWLPGWPVRASWLAGVCAAWLATALPVQQPSWRLLNAAAAHILTVQLRASARRHGHNCPGLRLDSLWRARTWWWLILVPAAGAVLPVGAWFAVRLARDTWPAQVPDVPGRLFLPPLAALGALAGLYPSWSRAALTGWREMVAQAALWRERWAVLKLDPAPRLERIEHFGPYRVEHFAAPPQEGWVGMRGKAPKLPAIVGGGTTVAVIPSPDVAGGNPVPGTIHPGRFAVVTRDAAQTVDVGDPGADPQAVLVCFRAAAEAACAQLGFAPVVLDDVAPVHADDSPVAAWRCTGRWPEGPDWSYARSNGWAGAFAERVGVPALINHRVDAGQLLAGAFDADDLVYADGQDEVEVRQLEFEDTWNSRWADVLKQGVNPPVPVHSETRTVTYRNVPIHRAVFQVRLGLNPLDHMNRRTEEALATTISRAPFVSVTGVTGRGSRRGTRHEQAFTVCYANAPLPSSPDQVADEREGSRVVLAAQVNAAFDAARLARPELVDARCLTRGGGFDVASIWRLDLRLYGGGTLADVRAGAERMRVALNAPWLRVDDADDGVTLYAGVPPGSARVDVRTRFTLTRLDWDQGWLAANVRGSAGLTPSLIAAETVPTNTAVTRASFTLPPGTSIPDVVQALPKLRTATGNAFVEIDREDSDAARLVLLASVEDPMPRRVAFDPQRVVDGGDAIEIAVGVSGQPEVWDIRDSPHLGVIGQSGSGKSAAMTIVLASALLAGFDVAVVDPIKSGADFKFAADRLVALGTNFGSGSAVMRWAIAETERRKKLNAQYGVSSFTKLPADVRPRRLLVMIDEFTSLIEKTTVPRTPAADPEVEAERQRVVEENTYRDDIGSIAGRISREARSVGVHLVVGAIKLRTTDLDKIPGGGTLKMSLARILLGVTSPGDRMSALRNAELAPTLDGQVPTGRGLYEPSVGMPRIVQTVFLPADDLAQAIQACREPVSPVDLAPYTRASTTGTPIVQDVPVDDSWDTEPVAVDADLDDLESLLNELDNESEAAMPDIGDTLPEPPDTAGEELLLADTDTDDDERMVDLASAAGLGAVDEADVEPGPFDLGFDGEETAGSGAVADLSRPSLDPAGDPFDLDFDGALETPGSRAVAGASRPASASVAHPSGSLPRPTEGVSGPSGERDPFDVNG